MINCGHCISCVNFYSLPDLKYEGYCKAGVEETDINTVTDTFGCIKFQEIEQICYDCKHLDRDTGKSYSSCKVLEINISNLKFYCGEFERRVI